jgi:glyoxylase-like metal-dependent hydrolase (beta-lactamase superfamily II)
MFARETEPALVADGVVGLGTELVNWYLVEDDGRVTIVDAGAPRYRPRLHRGLALLGRRPADVAAVLTEVDVPGAPRAIHTPGHTAGHAAFWLESRGVLVMGDLLCTRNPLTGARGPQLMPSAFNLSNSTILDSLSKVESLDAGVLLFGHGEPWTQGAADAVRRARETGPT